MALWNGYIAGGSTGLSINAPIRIATDRTVFSMPEVYIGYLADSGATYYLSRTCEQEMGLYLGVSGE